MTLSKALAAAAAGIVFATSAFAQSAKDIRGPSPYVAIENEPGRVLAIDRLRVDGSDFRDACPGISGSYTAQGTMIVAGLALPLPALAEALRGIGLDRNEAEIGVSELPRSAGLIVRVLAADGAALKRAMSFAWCAARRVLKGSAPSERRK